MACLFDMKKALHPCYDFMRRWICRLIQTDDPVELVVVHGTGEGRVARWDDSEVSRLDIKLVIVLMG